MSIICVGEMLIDFISTDIGSSLLNSVNFIKKAGGAPANVAAVASRLGSKSYFLGKVGNDSFGKFLKGSLEYHKVDSKMLLTDKDLPTTLAFVSLEKNGERDFSFVEGADRNLKIEEVNMDFIDSASILHFGSATALLGKELKKTYKYLYNHAREQRKFISFDPNYRSAFWSENKETFIKESLDFIKYSNFLKLSEEELELISQEKKLEEGVKRLHQEGAKIIAVTLGKKGTFISYKENKEIIESIKVEAIDTTGAGDAFVGAFLHYFSKEKNVDFNIIKNCVSKANRVAAMICTKMGAMEAIDILNSDSL